MTTTRPGTRFLKVYEAKDGFRWHLRYNGDIVSESGQAYRRRPTAKRQALQYGIPAGDFPVCLTYQKYAANKLVWVQERIR